MQSEGVYPLDRVAEAAQRTSFLWNLNGLGLGLVFVWGSILAPIVHVVPAFRRFGLVLVSVTLSSFMLFHVVGTISLTDYVAVGLKTRYWAPAAVLFVILVASIGDGLLHRWVAPSMRLAAGTILFACVLVVGAYSAWGVAHRAGQHEHSMLVREFLTAYSVIRTLQPNVPIYVGPDVTERIIERYGGLDTDVQPASILRDSIKRNQSTFILLMDASEDNPIEAGVFQTGEFEFRRLTAKDHGVLVPTDRAAMLKAAFGWCDPTMLVPPRSLVIYQVWREDARPE
jgi:hypothetical protein